LMTRSAIRRRRALKAISMRMPLALRPFARFSYVYFIKKGFLDGAHGFLYALMLGIYEGMTSILVYEHLFSERIGGGYGDKSCNHRAHPVGRRRSGTNEKQEGAEGNEMPIELTTCGDKNPRVTFPAPGMTRSP